VVVVFLGMHGNRKHRKFVLGLNEDIMLVLSTGYCYMACRLSYD